MDPAGDALAHILAVGGEVDAARLLQRLQRRDRRHQLHPVVGGVGLAALQFLLGVTEFEDGAPAALPRISRAGAVGEDRNLRLLAHAAHPDGAMPYSRALRTFWWKRSLRTNSSGSFGRTSALFGTLRKSPSRVSR